jgi:hypothetical protein
MANMNLGLLEIDKNERITLLNQRVEEEFEQVQEIIGTETLVTGFYPYGKIAPFNGHTSCELHNKTMTFPLISQ